jgi:hypothetical protein
MGDGDRPDPIVLKGSRKGGAIVLPERPTERVLRHAYHAPWKHLA